MSTNTMSSDTTVSSANEPGACRLCRHTDLQSFLDLGITPLSDRILTVAKKAAFEPTFPLEVVFCPSCTLVQILEEVPPAVLYGDEYPYYSSFSDFLLKHSRENALGLIESRGLSENSLVVELASNDGYLLKNFAEAGIPVLGIDPAEGPANVAIAAGIPTLIEFWGPPLAQRLVDEGKRADVIIANNVMAHIPDLNGFVAGMRTLIADDGVISIENPSVRALIDHGEFDTIYHEHHSYFSCTSVDALMRRNGLFLNDVKYFENLHGGTLRWICGPNEQVSAEAQRHLDEEKAAGVTTFDYYRNFSAKVDVIKHDLLKLLRDLKAQGATIAGYGAAAKASTMINFVGIDETLVDFVVDRNVHKHGCWMPGGRLPILPPSALLERRPDYTIVFAWNLLNEISSQQTEYLDGGGKFIVPVPAPRIV
jgi:SAM-dependent methyltransferase